MLRHLQNGRCRDENTLRRDEILTSNHLLVTGLSVVFPFAFCCVVNRDSVFFRFWIWLTTVFTYGVLCRDVNRPRSQPPRKYFLMSLGETREKGEVLRLGSGEPSPNLHLTGAVRIISM